MRTDGLDFNFSPYDADRLPPVLCDCERCHWTDDGDAPA